MNAPTNWLLPTLAPDVVLLDCSLPGLPQAGGLAAVRPTLLPVPAIALSIRAEDGPLALAAGADDFIHKFFAPEKIRNYAVGCSNVISSDERA